MAALILVMKLKSKKLNMTNFYDEIIFLVDFDLLISDNVSNISLKTKPNKNTCLHIGRKNKICSDNN